MSDKAVMTQLIGAAINQMPDDFAVYMTRSIDNPDDQRLIVHDTNLNAWVVTVEPLAFP